MQLRRGSYIMKMKVQRTAEENPAAVFCGEGRIMKKFLLALLAFITVSCPAFASDWVYVGGSSYEQLVYVDRDSVIKSHGEVGGWVKFEESDGRKYLCRVSVRERDRSMAIVSFIFYDVKGNIIEQQTAPYMQYDPVPPDSVGEIVYNFLMENTKSSG